MRTSISFTPAFLKSQLVNENQPGSSQPAQQSQALITYSSAKYGSINGFIASPDFKKFREEYAEVLKSIKAFMHDHADHLDPPLSVETRRKVNTHFDAFEKRLFNARENDFDSLAAKENMYQAGKKMFHEFAGMLQDKSILLQNRMNAVLTLTDRMEFCFGGIASDLSDVTAILAAYKVGLKGRAHQWKIKMLDELILQHVKANHSPYMAGEEIHFINAYYNLLAGEMGVAQRQDDYVETYQDNIHPEQLDACKRHVREKLKLKPTQLAANAADHYRGQIEEFLNKENIKANKIDEDGFDKLKALMRALKPEYGDVSMSVLLEPDPDDIQLSAYIGKQHPIRGTRHFLKAFKKLGMIDYDQQSKVVLGKTEEGRILVRGDLLWVEERKHAPVYELTASSLFKLSPKELLDNIEKAEPEDVQERITLVRAVLQRGAELLEAAWPAEEKLLGTWLCDFAAEMQERQSSAQEWSNLVVLFAVKFNQAFALDALLNAGGDQNATEENGQTALMLAARSGHAEVIETLISREANINATDIHGNTALMLAASKGHVKPLEVLLKAGADIKTKNNKGHTGLYLALDNGHGNAVRAFGELLKLVPEEQRAELLAAKNNDGYPGLWVALGRGHGDAVRAFGELLQEMSEAQRAELLAAKNNDGYPGLWVALGRGHGEAVRAFGELLQEMSEAQRAELLAAKDNHGVPGLYVALDNGHGDAVRAFGELLQRVPETQRAELLAAKDDEGFPGLHMALDNGHGDAVRAFSELLQLVPEAQRAELLAAKNNNGFPGLYMALKNGHGEAVRAFGELLQLVPDAQHAELLAAKNDYGYLGLGVALDNGHGDAVRAFGELLKLVPDAQRAELLAAKDNDGAPGLYLALENGHGDAVRAFGELLELVPDAQRPELLAAKNDDGYPGLWVALGGGHGEAVRVFGELLKLVPDAQRAGLLAAKENDGVPGLWMALGGGMARP